MRILEEMTDEELALAYVEGNNKAFDLLLSRNEVKLFSYIMFVVHDEQLATISFRKHLSRPSSSCRTVCIPQAVSSALGSCVSLIM